MSSNLASSATVLPGMGAPFSLQVAPSPSIPEGASVWDLSSVLDDPTVRSSITYTWDIVNRLKDPKGAEQLGRVGVNSPEIRALRWAKSVNAWAQGLPGGVDPTKDPEATRRHLLYLWNLGLITQATEGGKLDPRKPEDYAKIKRNYAYLLQQAKADDDKISVDDLQKMYKNFAATVPLPPGDPRTVNTFWEWLKHPQLGGWAKLGLLFGIPASLIGVTSAVMTRNVSPLTILMMLAGPLAGLGAYYGYTQDKRPQEYRRALEQDVKSVLSTLGYRGASPQVPSTPSTAAPESKPNQGAAQESKQADFRELSFLLSPEFLKQAVEVRLTSIDQPPSKSGPYTPLPQQPTVRYRGPLVSAFDMPTFTSTVQQHQPKVRLGPLVSALDIPESTPTTQQQPQHRKQQLQQQQPQQRSGWTVGQLQNAAQVWSYLDSLTPEQKAELVTMVRQSRLDGTKKNVLIGAINADRLSRWLAGGEIVSSIQETLKKRPGLKSKDPMEALQIILSEG